MLLPISSKEFYKITTRSFCPLTIFRSQRTAICKSLMMSPSKPGPIRRPDFPISHLRHPPLKPWRRLCMCVSINAGKCFLRLSRSWDVKPFQLLLVFCGGTLERRMFSFRIGLLHWPDKHENKDSTGCFCWSYLILNCCSTFKMKGTSERSRDGRMMRIPFLLYCALASK